MMDINSHKWDISESETFFWESEASFKLNLSPEHSGSKEKSLREIYANQNALLKKYC